MRCLVFYWCAQLITHLASLLTTERVYLFLNVPPFLNGCYSILIWLLYYLRTFVKLLWGKYNVYSEAASKSSFFLKLKFYLTKDTICSGVGWNN